jgi:rRNA maturation endonuclease Nob1
VSVVRKCLGCGYTYPHQEHACPKCGSHAAEAEQLSSDRSEDKPKAKPPRPRKG